LSNETTIWTVSEPRIIELMSHFADDFEIKKWTKEEIDHFLELYPYIVRGELTEDHRRLIASLAKKAKRKRPSKTYCIEELDELPDWTEREGGVYVNVAKAVNGKRKQFTIYTHLNGSDLLAHPQFVPVDTQPSADFIESVGDFATVFTGLTDKYKRYLFFADDMIYAVLALGAMTTYFREIFNSTAYFDMYAAELDCGKTTAMLAIIWASFYGFAVVDPTEAVLFRAVDSCHSAIGIDELDNRLVDPEAQGRLLGLLDAAYKKGLVAYRIDMDAGGLPTPYDPFGLKSFSHVNPIPYSIQNRSIVFGLIRSPIKLPDLDSPNIFKEERDLMYKLRLVNGDAIRESYKLTKQECKLMNRDAQKFNPLLTIARLISPELYTKVESWANEYVESSGEQTVDEIKRTLVESLLGFSGDVKVRTIAEKFNALCFERELIGTDKKTNEPRKYGSRAILDMLASLGIKKSKTRTDNNVHVRVLPKRVRAWAESYNLPIPSESSLSSFSSFVEAPTEQNPPLEAKEDASSCTGGMSFEMRIEDQASQTSFETSSVQVTPSLTEPVTEPVPEAPDPELENERSWVRAQNEDNEANEVSRGTPSSAFPKSLSRLFKLWKKQLLGLKDGFRPENDSDYDTIMLALQAGYVINIMPENLYYLTEIAREELKRCGIK